MKLNKSTINNVDIIINFICSLVFKNETAAFEAETPESSLKASIYLAAFLKQDDLPDNERELIIENYKEENPYYKKLQDKYGILPAIARLAKDFELIYVPESHIVQNSYLSSYSTIYRKCLQNFYVTSFSPAMLHKENYRELCLFMINLMAFLNMQAKWLENPYDLGLMSETNLDHFMYSFGVPFFRDLPLKHKQTIAQNLNNLISNKGTNKVVLDILSMFNFDNITINKYYLAKRAVTTDVDEKNNLDFKNRQGEDVYFLSHDVKIDSLSEAIKNNKVNKYNYEQITHRDDHWQLDKSDVLSLDFDYVQTKYFSIETGFDLSAEVANTTLLLNLIRRMRSDYPTKGSLDVQSNLISESRPAKLEDIIVTLQILMCEFQGLEDIIQHDLSPMAKTLEFAKIDYPVINTDLVRKIPNVRHRTQIELKNLADIDKYNMDSLDVHYKYNLGIKENFETLLKQETNYWRYKQLRAAYNAKFYQNLNTEMYQGFNTLTEYITFNNSDLAKIIKDIRAIPNKLDRTNAINSMIVELSDIIIEKLSNFNVFLGVTTTNILLEYVKKVISVFKSFTVSLLDINVFILIKDNHYKLFDYMRLTNTHLAIDNHKYGAYLEDTIVEHSKIKKQSRIPLHERWSTRPMTMRFKEPKSIRDMYRMNLYYLKPYVERIHFEDTHKASTRLVHRSDKIFTRDKIVIKRISR